MSQITAGNDDLDGQAIKRAAEAFDKLPGGSQLFQDCIANTDTIDKLIESIKDGFASRRKTKGNRLLEVFDKHTAGLRNLSGAIDVAVQTRANIICPIWAPIKMLLLVSDCHATVVNQIKTMIQTIAEHLPQLELYKKLGANSSLHTALLNVFTDVVEFCVVVHSHISQRLLTRIWKLSMSSFRQDFQDRIDRLKLHVKIVNDSAMAIELVRASEFRSEDLRYKCQTWLNAANMNQVHQSRLHTKLAGTCEWLWSHSAYKAWEAIQSGADDRTLRIWGKSGCGKSILASSLVDSLRQRGGCIIYFSFSGTDTSRSTDDHLVHSLLWQVVQDPIYETGLEVMQRLMAQGPPATMVLWDALYQILEPITDPMCCVIDGVDECTDLVSDVLGHISQLLGLSKSSKAIILGRPHALKPDAISGYFIDITTGLVEGDLHSFITANINQHDNLQQLGTKDAVLSTMLRKSDGMFLWAKFMVADLSTASSAKEVMHKMQHQPRGLEAAYLHILRRLQHTLDEVELRLAQCLLGLIAVAGRPLDVEELNYAQEWVLRAQDDSSINSALDEYLLLDAKRKIRRVCGGLIDINIKDSMVNLIHVTAREFLIRPMEVWGEHKSSVALFRTCPPTSHQLLGLACLEHLALFGTKLKSTDDDEETSTVDPSRPLLEYAAHFALYHINRADDPDPTW